MSRVEIHSADGRKVIVEHEGELEPIRAAAMTLWQETAGPEPSRGPATGFQITDRRYSPPVQPSSMRRSPGAWPIQSGQIDAESPPTER